MKEYVNKRIVNLKRAPQRIPLGILVICCIIYTFHLSEHSNASMLLRDSQFGQFLSFDRRVWRR